jgi:hypothetical protein
MATGPSFTHALLKALAEADYDGDGHITVAEIELKIGGLVPKLIEERSHYKQNTQSELNNAHFPLAKRQPASTPPFEWQPHGQTL